MGAFSLIVVINLLNRSVMNLLFEETLLVPGKATNNEQAIISLLTPIKTIMVSYRHVCAVYRLIEKNANQNAIQKLGNIKLQSGNQFTSKSVLDVENNRVMAIQNKNEVICWSLNNEDRAINPSESFQSVFKEEKLSKFKSLLKINNKILVLGENGNILDTVNPSFVISLFGEETGAVSIIHAEVSEQFCDTKFYRTLVVLVYEDSKKSNFVSLHQVDIENVENCQKLYSFSVDSKAYGVNLPEKFDETLSQDSLRMFLVSKKGETHSYGLLNGEKLGSFPFQIRSIFSGDKFVCYSENKLALWCEPLNHVMFTKEYKKLQKVETDREVSVLVCNDSKTVEVFSNEYNESSTTILDLVEKCPFASKGKTETMKMFESLCEILKSETALHNTVWGSLSRNLTIKALRDFNAEQVKTLFNICSANFDTTNQKLRVFLLTTCELLVIAQQDVIVELLQVVGQTQFRSDISSICDRVTSELEIQQGMQECLMMYDKLTALSAPAQKRDTKFYITYLDI